MSPSRETETDIFFQLLQILKGLSDAGLKIIGSDVVEFSPIYDNAAETTGIAISEIIYEILQWMVHVPVKTPNKA
jgi:agmatinase